MTTNIPTDSRPLARGKKVYFISDLHLGARYFPSQREMEKRVVDFLDHAAADADSIYLLGDVLDYWYEYRYVVPKGFVRFFGKLAELTDRGVSVIWLTGNHDIWLFDYLPHEIGIEVADGPLIRRIGSKTFFLAHGDGLGKTDLAFKTIRAIFRNKFCQRLYSAIHPRWTIPFALSWSKSSRKQGEYQNPTGESASGAKNLQQFAAEYASIHPDIDYFIFGHVHCQTETILPQGKKIITLGGWIEDCDVASFDGTELKLS